MGSHRLINKAVGIIRLMPLYQGPDQQYQNDEREAHYFDPFASVVKTAEFIRLVRDRYGYAFQLGIDFHHRLSMSQTIQFCSRLRPGDIDFLEEPIRGQSPKAYAALRQCVSVSLAIGEEMSNKWDFAPYLEENLTQFARTDVANIGGLTEARKVAALSEGITLSRCCTTLWARCVLRPPSTLRPPFPYCILSNVKAHIGARFTVQVIFATTIM